MNFSRRSFASSARRRPQWTATPQLCRSALPIAPSPFFRPAAKPQPSLQLQPAPLPPAQPCLLAA